MIKNKIAIGVAFLLAGTFSAQQSAQLSQKTRYKLELADNLYETKIHSPSKYIYDNQYFYNDYLTALDKEAAQFFGNLIGVLLQKQNAEVGLDAIIAQNPQSAFFGKANLPLADYYLVKKDFVKALEVLKKVNQAQLSDSENAEYVLKYGYTKFMLGDTKSAKRALKEAYESNHSSQKDNIAYMLGHLHYSEEEYDKAFEYFDPLKENPQYAQTVQPYYVQMYYNEGDYDKAITEGMALIHSESAQSFVNEAKKIVGESYFRQQKYTEAYPYLKAYIENTSSPSDADLYEMGFVAAQMEQYSEAVSYYNQLINSKSPLAQNAFYQLGNAYLQNGQKAEALAAFRSASQMDYDKEAKQLAAQQYAKLSYEIGNPFESSSKALQDYLDQYGGKDGGAEIKQLLVKSYIYSGDFKATLDAIDRMQSTTPEVDKIDQEVAYLLGTEEYNNSQYEQAEKYYLRSLKKPINKVFVDNALYGLGQTYYSQERYEEALEQFKKIEKSQNFEKKDQLQYDLGYTYLKLNKFAEARKAFEKYVASGDKAHREDALARIANTHYAENNAGEAIKTIDTIANQDANTMFQKAVALGDLEKHNEKITALKSLLAQYPNSEYTDDAHYEMGVAYAMLSDYKNSDASFQKVLKNSQEPELIIQSELYLVQNDIQQNRLNEAEKQLVILGKKYQGTPFAGRVMTSAKLLYGQKGDADGLQKFAQTIGESITQNEIEEINLTTARNLYADKKYTQAIPLYEKYLAQNSLSENYATAQYELGDCYYQTKAYTKAKILLDEVAKTPSAFQEEAMTRLAQIHLKENKTNEAQGILEKIKSSNNPSIRNFAMAELLTIYSKENDMVNAVPLAQEIEKSSGISAAVIDQAKAIQARAMLNEGKEKEAQNSFAKLEKSVNRAVAAEALFRKAFFQNKAKSYKASNETIFRLSNNYASEEYWGAKALVVMAKNYIGLKDNYQASYTLDQIIENYQDFEDVVNEAKKLKSTIKK